VTLFDASIDAPAPLLCIDLYGKKGIIAMNMIPYCHEMPLCLKLGEGQIPLLLVFLFSHLSVACPPPPEPETPDDTINESGRVVGGLNFNLNDVLDSSCYRALNVNRRRSYHLATQH